MTTWLFWGTPAELLGMLWRELLDRLRGRRVALATLAVALATGCGGSVEADPSPACPTYLQTLRYAEPTRDPSGTSEATATGCVTPAGQRAQLSTVWCCQ